VNFEAGLKLASYDPERIQMVRRRIIAVLCAMSVASASFMGPALAEKKRQGPSLIRDAEIESLMRLYTKPIFQTAGLTPSSVNVYLINDPRINAFVAGGQRIFINTGLLTQAKTPNEVIGVLAHETGHISGSHLARMQNEIDRKSSIAIVGMLIGVAAMAGGAAAGEGEVAQAGSGIMMGAQGLTQRLVLSYARAMEASADQAAIKFLTATGQSGKGMLTLFQKLANQSMASLRNVDPYIMSHPMPLDRIRNLEIAAKASKYFNTPDDPKVMLRHKLMQAKLVGFLQPAQTVFQRYPQSDKSLPGRYARAISMFRSGDTRNAVTVIDTLIRDLPDDPYFHELKGQALLEGGQPAAAVAPLRRALKIVPNSGLIRIMLAQALLGTENKANAQAALTELRLARKTEDDTATLYQFMAMAYGQLGDIPRADLATAEAAYYRGDKKLAEDKAKVAMATLKRGSPDWLRANDILNFVNRE
jgi:predicted Zn-dependent protease